MLHSDANIAGAYIYIVKWLRSFQKKVTKHFQALLLRVLNLLFYHRCVYSIHNFVTIDSTSFHVVDVDKASSHFHVIVSSTELRFANNFYYFNLLLTCLLCTYAL